MSREKFVFISDPGRDQDDEDTLVAANIHIRLMVMELLGVVANLAPAKERAWLAKKTLMELGQGDIPVGVGTSCGQPEKDGLDYQFDAPYFGPAPVVDPGKQLLIDLFKKAGDKEIVLVLLSGLTDAADFLRDHRELFLKKVKRVAIMGGVKANDYDPKAKAFFADLAGRADSRMATEVFATGVQDLALDENGFFLPDLTAQNHKFDEDAAEYFYRELQNAGIQMVIVSRHAAAAAKVPRRVYDDMAATGSQIGVRLRDAQQKALEELWQRACMDSDDPQRMGLPERCDKKWFCGMFLGGQGNDRDRSDSIWDLVVEFALYDPITMIAAMSEMREIYFKPAIIEVKGVKHHVIGVSDEHHNVKSGYVLSQTVMSSMVHSLVMAEDDEELQYG